MPRKSYSDLYSDWEGLLQACRANQDRLPGLEQVLGPLADTLIQMKALKVIRQMVAGSAQEMTHSLHEARESGNESARRLRSFVRSRLGTQSEQLPQFGIAPLRARQGPKKQQKRNSAG
jgi:hypothetical protein